MFSIRKNDLGTSARNEYNLTIKKIFFGIFFIQMLSEALSKQIITVCKN